MIIAEKDASYFLLKYQEWAFKCKRPKSYDNKSLSTLKNGGDPWNKLSWAEWDKTLFILTSTTPDKNIKM